MELLTVQETAERLRIAPVTVRRYIASGRLAAVRVGRGLRVRRDAVEGFIEPIASDPLDRPRNESVDDAETLTAALVRLVGLAGADGDEDGVTDVSANKYKHLAEAYAPRRP